MTGKQEETRGLSPLSIQRGEQKKWIAQKEIQRGGRNDRREDGEKKFRHEAKIRAILCMQTSSKHGDKKCGGYG